MLFRKNISQPTKHKAFIDGIIEECKQQADSSLQWGEYKKKLGDAVCDRHIDILKKIKQKARE